MMYHDGVLMLCGANANGHFWPQFVSGEFERRRLVALSAEDGYKLWAKDANYRHRPIIIGNQVLAEPWSFDLHTGDQLTRPHPLTGEDVPWSIMRTGHHCGMLTGCDSGMILFRSGFTGFFDLNEDAGVEHFVHGRVRRAKGESEPSRCRGGGLRPGARQPQIVRRHGLGPARRIDVQRARELDATIQSRHAERCRVGNQHLRAAVAINILEEGRRRDRPGARERRLPIERPRAFKESVTHDA